MNQELPQTKPKTPTQPFNPYLCAKTGTHCVEPSSPPEPNCTISVAGLGWAGGALVGAGAVLTVVGTPESEGAEAALAALEAGKAAANSGLIGGSYGTLIGMIFGLSTCP